MDIKGILELYNKGINITPERHAVGQEVLDELQLIWNEASPEDKDSPSVLTGGELGTRVIDRIGKKLLGS